MASYNELNALIDAYINRNGVQAITGQILNGVLKAMVEQLGRGYTIMGAAIPATDPGTPDGPECYFASETGTYTDFDGLQIVPGELALLCYTPSDGWTKNTIYEGFQTVQATIDGNVGTPSVGVSYADGVLSFDFHNMKGNPGQNGQDGAAAGFGTIGADITGGVGTPGVTVDSSGPATAKNLQFHFTNLKGETGVTSVVATVDNTTGNPACTVSLVGQQLTLAFSGLKGAQGNTGSSVDYPFTIVNNLTTDDATQALSAAQGVVLDGKISQLEAKVDGITTALTGWQSGYIADNQGVGNTCPKTVSVNAAYKYQIVPIQPNYVYIINGAGGIAPQLWAFLDENDIILSTSGDNVSTSGTPVTLVPTEGATQLIINSKSGESCYSYTGLIGRMNAKQDKEIGKSLINKDFASGQDAKDDPVWMQVITDQDGRIICGVKKDGSTFIEKPEFGKKDDAGVLDYDFVKSQEGVLVEKRLIPFTRSTPSESVNYNTFYKSLIVAFMTDSHTDMGDKDASWNNLKDAIRYANGLRVPVSAILEGGDLITETSNTKDEFKERLKNVFALAKDSGVPFLYTKGNHDVNAIGVASAAVLTDDDWGEVYFNEAETKYGIVRNTKSNGKKSGYYYYDIPEYKVRIICVDCYDLDFSVMQNNKVLYKPGDASYIANEQFNWIANTALDFDGKDEKDWGVLVFTHYYRASDIDGTTISPIFRSAFGAFNNMLVAFNTQSEFSEEYVFPDNSFFNLDVNADFTRYASLDKKPFIIGVICGHLHLDINYSKDGIQNIFTGNQFCGDVLQVTDQRMSRVAGTATQNLFDLYAIDLHNRKIRAIRYGAGMNCYGVGGDRFTPNGLSF